MLLQVFIAEGNFVRAQVVDVGIIAMYIGAGKLAFSIDYLLFRSPTHSNLAELIVGQIHQGILLEQTVVIADGEFLLPTRRISLV